MQQIQVPSAVLTLVGALQAKGFRAYLVGGCVRDSLMGLAPKDWDITTDATPDQLQQVFPQAKLVGESFGVIVVRGTEVATFRADGIYTDGRRPDSVVFVKDPYQDSLRRDFTINAMYFDPRTATDALAATDESLDFHGGQEDLATGTLRCVGDPNQRFSEDYLRMLRAVRFAARFNLSFDPATFESIKAHAGSITEVAAERVRMELEHTLLQANPDQAFRLMASSVGTRVARVDVPEGLPTAGSGAP